MEGKNKRTTSHTCNKFLLAKAICRVTGKARAAVRVPAWSTTPRWHRMICQFSLQKNSVFYSLIPPKQVPENVTLGRAGWSAPCQSHLEVILKNPSPSFSLPTGGRRLCPAPFSGEKPQRAALRGNITASNRDTNDTGMGPAARAVLLWSATVFWRGARQNSFLRARPQAELIGNLCKLILYMNS